MFLLGIPQVDWCELEGIGIFVVVGDLIVVFVFHLLAVALGCP